MKQRPPIGPMHPRLVATFALIPITIGIEIALYVAWSYSAFNLFGGANSWVQLAWPILLFVAPVIAFYGGGLLIWWPTVAWTPRKRFGVLVTTLTLILLHASTALLLFVAGESMGIALILVSLIGGGIALVVVSRICWEPRERPDVPCPKCGYDLRGQRECRCPECGEEYTLGDLVRSSED